MSQMPGGVIGNTAAFGAAFPGSSPGPAARDKRGGEREQAGGEPISAAFADDKLGGEDRSGRQ